MKRFEETGISGAEFSVIRVKANDQIERLKAPTTGIRNGMAAAA